MVSPYLGIWARKASQAGRMVCDIKENKDYEWNNENQ
jgi:hypothetical protein